MGSFLGAGDGEVFQPTSNKGEDLILAGFGDDLKFILLNQLFQLFLIAGELEEVVFLLHLLGHGAMFRAFSINQFFFGFKLLAAHAVEAFVSFFVNIIRIAGFPEFLRSFNMALFGGADKIIEGEI